MKTALRTPPSDSSLELSYDSFTCGRRMVVPAGEAENRSITAPHGVKNDVRKHKPLR